MKTTSRANYRRFQPGNRVKVTNSTRRPDEMGSVIAGSNPPPSNPPLTIAVRFDDGYIRWYHPAQLTLVR